ncbi:glycoside hydrolase family 6 protein [Plantactinospora sp. KLBMP9567]|uniref:glycoside hydrolase family 6 protein n=1 Tax=Plantactinospora sp. KLBMP9567 TaxID=3085900 RepID=UPI0029827939|nr:glycoside hydrolase family 6 protein [Plantactinospora sp. KLBMP9567]MDW5326997.1 glycoside hydrolase family 6 protein [Plantactinospora sp. KLBMP9567]
MKRPARPLLALAAALAVAVPTILFGSSAAYADPISQTSGFYVNPQSSPASWVAANPGDGRANAIRTEIAQKPMASWFGNWSGDITAAVGNYVAAADAVDKLPLLVAYNLPGRDACGGHSGGGAGSVAAYDAWIAAFASAIGNRPAVVVLEPDSLGDFNCMTQPQINDRVGMLARAANQFRSNAPNTWAYLDAGNPGWVDARTMAQRLNMAGVANAHGFALNVSNYFTTGENTNYGNAVASTLRNDFGYTKPYVIDTSRNGNGSNGEWCNPAGRRIGTPTQTGGGAEMLLWLKTPGESDGNCGVGAGSTAGQFLPEVAYKMIFGY